MNTQSSTAVPMDTDHSVQTQAETRKHRRAFEVFSWENLQSNLTNSRPASNRIPPAADPDSAFLDMQQVPNEIDGLDIAQALPTEAIGSKFRADTKFIQIFFDETDEADSFIQEGTLSVKHYDIPILPPKGKLAKTALIRLDNVPMRKRNTMQEKINLAMAEFCLPVEIAPITLKGTSLMTTRWEVLAKAIPNSNLAQTLPSIIVIDGQKVLLSWPGSPLTCLQCLSVGHSRKNCPKRTKAAPVQKQGTAPSKQKSPANTYAAAVVQGAPEHNRDTDTEYSTQGPSNMEQQSTTESQGNSATQISQASLEQKRSETPQPPNQIENPEGISEYDSSNMIPQYDSNSPFNATQEESEYTDSLTNPNSKKRHIQVTPSGSPVPKMTSNIMGYFTKAPRRDNPDPQSHIN